MIIKLIFAALLFAGIAICQPQLTAIAPTSGVAGTVVNVVLTGLNFQARLNGSLYTPQVTAAGIAVTSVAAITNSQITAVFTLPATLAAGPVSIQVATVGGVTTAVPFTVIGSAPTPIAVTANSPISQTVAVNASSAGPNLIVAGVPGGSIRVLSYVLAGVGPVTLTWESSGGMLLSGPMIFPGTVSIAVPYNPVGQFSTLPGESLMLFLDSASQVGGHITFEIAQ
jgi:hypothetical protein